MSEPITYVGIDAHKVELHVALLAPDETEPVTWTVRNEVRAVDRLRRKLERAAPGQPPRRANPKNDVPRHPAPPLVVEAASGCGSSKPRNTGECNCCWNAWSSKAINRPT